jgi:RNA polymerase sigma factor (sigma-70 family)
VSLADPLGEDPDAPTLGECLGTDDPGYRASELRDEIEQALSGLAPLADQAVRLRYEAELSFGEIAHRLGISQSYASKLVGRSLLEMGKAMRLEAA